MNQALSVYSSWLAATVGKVKLIGESREFDLEKIFVELTIFEEYRRPTDKDALWSLMDAELRKKRTLFPPDEDKRRPKSWDEGPGFEAKKVRRVIQPDQLIKPGTRALVVGAPGCGKTTLMRWLAWMTHNHGQHLPVFLELKTVAKALTEKRPLGEILIETITGRCFQTQSPEGFKQYFLEQLKIGNVTILLDGLDEISDQKNLLQEATRDFLAPLPHNVSLIVSTRPYALTSAFAGLEQMEIGPLADQQMSNFLKHYYQDRPEVITGLEKELKQQTELRGLARVPFLLGAIAWLYREHGIASGEPLKLYDYLVKQLAGKPDEEKGIQRFQFPDSKDHDTKREFLAFLASERLLDRTRQDKDDWLVFSKDEIKETAARFCRMSNVKSTDSISLAEDVIHTALLREVGLERYTFIHLTIHEYLGAKALARDKKAFCRAFFNPTLAEMEVLPMALGMTSNPDSFYEALEQLPESLDFKNLRVRVRGLRYAGARLSELRINHHADRMMEFVRGGIKREETPYQGCVLYSFSRAGNRVKQIFIQKLLRLVRDKDWTVRKNAARALGELGVESEPIVTALLGLLRDKAKKRLIPKLRSWVVTALIGLLPDKESYVQSTAAWALGQLGVKSEIVLALTWALWEEELSVREIAAKALGQLGVESEAIVTTLLGLLEDKESIVRGQAAMTLGGLKVGGGRVVTALLGLMEDKESLVRAYAAEALGQLGVESEAVITTLLGLLRDKEWYIRAAAAGVLAQLGVGSERVVTGLLGLLRDKEPYVRARAAEALGQLGEVSEAAAAELLELLLRDEKYWVWERAVVSWWLWQPQDKKSYVKASAAGALVQLGMGNEAVVSWLLGLLQDKEPYVQARAARALVQLGMGSEAVVTALAGLLRDEWETIRASAAKSLNLIAPDEFSRGMTTAISVFRFFSMRLRIVETVGYYANDPNLLNKLNWLKWLSILTFRFGLCKTAADAAVRYQRKLDLFRDENLGK